MRRRVHFTKPVRLEWTSQSFYKFQFSFQAIVLCSYLLTYHKLLLREVKYCDNLECVNTMDFVVQSPKELGYYQVCKTLNAQEIMQRELAPLRKLRDNCKKTILTMDNLE